MSQGSSQGLAFILSMMALGITLGVAIAKGGWFWLSAGALAVASAAQYLAYKKAKAASSKKK